MAATTNKIWEQASSLIARINEKNPYYTLGAFLLVLFLADYFLVMSVQLRALYRLTPKVTTLLADLKTTQGDIAKKKDYEREVARLRLKAQEMHNLIRTRDQIPLIVESLSRLARKNGVLIEQMTPDASLLNPVHKDNEGQYYAIPLLIKARAGYHQFGKFLNQLEKEETFISVKSFQLEASPTDATHEQIQMTLSAIVFERQSP